MNKIVITQPMFMPWIGLFQQFNLAKTIVYFDDVQLPLGRSFTNRVQVQTKDGVKWLTVPIKRSGKQLIKDVKIDNSSDWKKSHLGTLKQSYGKAPYAELALNLVDDIYSNASDSLSDFCIFGIERITEFLGLKYESKRSSCYKFNSFKSEKLLDIISAEGAKNYLTGHGAAKYLDHHLFEASNVKVEYIDYNLPSYNQLFKPFTPFVSIVDLIANVGFDTINHLEANTMNWREFINE